MPTLNAQTAEDLAGRFFDFLVEQPTERFVDPERVLAHLDLALTPANVERVVRDRLQPLLAREKERAKRSQDQVGDLFTPEAAEVVKRRLGEPWQLDRAMLRRLSQQESVRYLLRNIVQESIDRFVQSLSSLGGSGLLGSIGRGAAGIASSVGSAVLGTVAPQLESQIKKAAGSFVSSSLNAIIDRLIDNATSPEGAARLGQMRATSFDTLLNLPSRKLSEGATEFLDESVLKVLPGWAAYSIGRKELRDAVLAELKAALAVEGSAPLKTFVGSAEQLAALRQDFIRVGGGLIVDFSGSPGFHGWAGQP